MSVKTPSKLEKILKAAGFFWKAVTAPFHKLYEVVISLLGFAYLLKLFLYGGPSSED